MITELVDIIEFARSIPEKRFPVLASLGKLTEETGEFAEATLVVNGYIDKTLKEPMAGELADIIICALDVYSRSNELYSPEEVIQILEAQLKLKTKKWKAKYK